VKITRKELTKMILEQVAQDQAPEGASKASLPSMNIEQQELIASINSIEKQLKELAQKLAALGSRVAGAE
jgi:hypothetical protein